MNFSMNKIISWLGQDGLAHIACCAALCGLLGLVLPLWAAALATLAVGAAKELVYDKWLGKGTASWKDLLCDIIGIAVGAL